MQEWQPLACTTSQLGSAQISAAVEHPQVFAGISLCVAPTCCFWEPASKVCLLLPSCCRYMFSWIGLSGAVIMVNKYILDPKLGNFPYPLTLTSTHMLFGTLFSWACVKAGLVAPVTMPWDTYLK